MRDPWGQRLIDAYNRPITYLRLSVTDRCNLRCCYCQSNAAQTYIPHEDILHYEEMLRFVGIVQRLGIAKVRVSGGEPFVRKGCIDFLRALRAHFPSLDLRITTNGTQILPFVKDLQTIRINAVNVSVDSLDPQTFARITSSDALPRVLEAVDALVCAGIVVKINAVAMQGQTEQEMERFIDFAIAKGIDVRFIEFMPMGKNTLWRKELFCPVSRLKERAEQLVDLVPVERTNATDGPARMYAIAGTSARLGFIAAVSDHFCMTCNRLRLTSEGSLRLCLFDDREYPIRALLRDPSVDDAMIAQACLAACTKKVIGSELLAASRSRAVANRLMSGIGG
ncbi:MAG: GTP 3',8-cyclase MoaA [Desulfovibrio sp.]|nr:GTP 3',8-cyclase MoaA [Desulfovibrio sp.]